MEGEGKGDEPVAKAADDQARVLDLKGVKRGVEEVDACEVVDGNPQAARSLALQPRCHDMQ